MANTSTLDVEEMTSTLDVEITTSVLALNELDLGWVISIGEVVQSNTEQVTSIVS